MKCAALVVLLSVAASASASPENLSRVKRLTTFSKPQDLPPAIGTRECKSQEDCSIKGTTCTEDRRDSRRRCICEDGNPPANGRCPNRKRGLKERCNRDDECIAQAHCVLNTTIHKTYKVCLCEPDVEEVDNMCGVPESDYLSLAIEQTEREEQDVDRQLRWQDDHLTRWEVELQTCEWNVKDHVNEVKQEKLKLTIKKRRLELERKNLVDLKWSQEPFLSRTEDPVPISVTENSVTVDRDF